MSDPGSILHPEAAQGITGIWEYIASDSTQAARRVRESILEAIGTLSHSRIRDTGAQI